MGHPSYQYLIIWLYMKYRFIWNGYIFYHNTDYIQCCENWGVLGENFANKEWVRGWKSRERRRGSCVREGREKESREFYRPNFYTVFSSDLSHKGKGGICILHIQVVNFSNELWSLSKRINENVKLKKTVNYTLKINKTYPEHPCPHYGIVSWIRNIISI
jgi:hypothetical protein